MLTLSGPAIAILIVLMLAGSAVKVLREFERGGGLPSRATGRRARPGLGAT